MTTDVLIVGGGPVGLAASIALSRCGVRSLLVEAHPTTTTHPKATVVNARTMELFRAWGVADAVRAGGIPPEGLSQVVWCTTLAGIEIGRLALLADAERGARMIAASPEPPTICPQDVVEPLLRARAEREPLATVRFGTACVDWEDVGDGVTATLEGADGTRTTVRAGWLVAADGASSPIRRRLGIALCGEEPLGHMLNVHFRADLRPWTAHRPSPLYWSVNAEVPGVFIALDGATRWLYDTAYDGEAETVADYPPERCAAIVRRAAGVPDLPVEIVDVSGWRVVRHVAERWCAGRVLLAGDAAHQFPPTGGFGMNSGIQDAHGLAWRLAAVIHGQAGDALLDTYTVERRAVAAWYTAFSARNAVRITRDLVPPPEIEQDCPTGAAIREMIAAGIEGQRDHFESTGAALGVAYASAAVVPDGTPSPALENPVRDYEPTARPGHRAPHAWLADGVSTLDVVDARFTLLAPGDGAAWREAVARAAARLGVAVVLVDLPPDVAARFGVGAGGAVLVRPDGHVAWRVAEMPSDAAHALGTALATVLARTG